MLKKALLPLLTLLTLITTPPTKSTESQNTRKVSIRLLGEQEKLVTIDISQATSIKNIKQQVAKQEKLWVSLFQEVRKCTKILHDHNIIDNTDPNLDLSISLASCWEFEKISTGQKKLNLKPNKPPTLNEVIQELKPLPSGPKVSIPYFLKVKKPKEKVKKIEDQRNFKDLFEKASYHELKKWTISLGKKEPKKIRYDITYYFFDNKTPSTINNLEQDSLDIAYYREEYDLRLYTYPIEKSNKDKTWTQEIQKHILNEILSCSGFNQLKKEIQICFANKKPFQHSLTSNLLIDNPTLQNFSWEKCYQKETDSYTFNACFFLKQQLKPTQYINIDNHGYVSIETKPHTQPHTSSPTHQQPTHKTSTQDHNPSQPLTKTTTQPTQQKNTTPTKKNPDTLPKKTSKTPYTHTSSINNKTDTPLSNHQQKNNKTKQPKKKITHTPNTYISKKTTITTLIILSLGAILTFLLAKKKKTHTKKKHKQ